MKGQIDFKKRFGNLLCSIQKQQFAKNSFVDIKEVKDKTAEGLDKNLRGFVQEHCKFFKFEFRFDVEKFDITTDGAAGEEIMKVWFLN